MAESVAMAATKQRGNRAKKPRVKRAKPMAKVRTRVRGEWPPNEPYDRGVQLVVGDPGTALKLLTAAVRRQPDRPRIHINLGWALSNLGQHDEAKVAARRAYELDPADPYIAARRVHVLFAAGDEAVVEAARHAMQLSGMPRDDRLYAHKAICWTLMRTARTEALRESELLIAEHPDDAESLAVRGCALAALCRWDDGLPWLDKAIAAAPSDPRFTLRREKIVEARDAAEHAMRSMREDVERHPTDARRWRELGMCLARFARLPEALEAFERAHALAPVGRRQKKLEPHVVAALMVEATARTAVVVGDIAPIG